MTKTLLTPDFFRTIADYGRRIATLERRSGGSYRTENLGNVSGTTDVSLLHTDQDVLVIATLVGNTTFVLGGLRENVAVTFLLTQDGAGNRTISFVPNPATPKGRALRTNLAAGKVNVITTFSSNGINLYAFLAGSDMRIPV